MRNEIEHHPSARDFIMLFNSRLEEVASDDSCTPIITEEQKLISREHELYLNELSYVS